MMLENLHRPPNRHYIFSGTNFDAENKAHNRKVKDMVQLITAMPCQMGKDIVGGGAQRTIAERIKHAFLRIADISKDNSQDGIRLTGIRRDQLGIA